MCFNFNLNSLSNCSMTIISVWLLISCLCCCLKQATLLNIHFHINTFPKNCHHETISIHITFSSKKESIKIVSFFVYYNTVRNRLIFSWGAIYYNRHGSIVLFFAYNDTRSFSMILQCYTSEPTRVLLECSQSRMLEIYWQVLWLILWRHFHVILIIFIVLTSVRFQF